MEEEKRVWLVQLEYGHELFWKEKDAKECYKNELERILNHKPNASNQVTYEKRFVSEDDDHYAIFLRKFGFQVSEFYINLSERTVR